MRFWSRLRAGALLYSLTLVALAAPPPLPMSHVVDLRDYSGKKTFLEVMLEKDTGIRAQIDADYHEEYAVPTWEQVSLALENFDGKVLWKTVGPKEGRETRLRATVDALAEQNGLFTPATFASALKGKTNGGSPSGTAIIFGMAAGAGTLVHIDDGSYFYNYAYKGEVTGGRSYGASRDHKANDATDIYYLTSLDAFLDKNDEKDIRQFYQTIVEVIASTDVSGFAKLSEEAQGVAADFVTVYTAESYRHILEKLNPKRFPWENDLAEATFVMNYNSLVDKIMKNGEFISVSEEGRPLDQQAVKDRGEDIEGPEYVWWWKNNPETKRSGIGKTQRDRRALSRILSRYERENNPKLVDAVEKLIGESPEGDVYQGLMEYFNQPRFLKDGASQKEILKQSKALGKAVAALVMQTRKDAAGISAAIEAEAQ